MKMNSEVSVWVKLSFSPQTAVGREQLGASLEMSVRACVCVRDEGYIAGNFQSLPVNYQNVGNLEVKKIWWPFGVLQIIKGV
jgi:hypothetical protein